MCRPKYSSENPMMTHALMLMTNVPYGNRVPSRPATAVPTQNLAKAPKEPPKAISQYFCTRRLSFHRFVED